MFEGFLGLALSLAYGLFGASLLRLTSGDKIAQRFLTSYIDDFGILVSFGVIAGAALIVGRSQRVITNTIEATFKAEDLSRTPYFAHRQRYFSKRLNTLFATEMILISFTIFRLCDFPFGRVADGLMMIAACAQYALASYVGRKLRYAGMMLHAIIQIDVKENLFRTRRLDIINTAVHIASTMTMAWVYLHVRGYYTGPFLYDTFFGKSAKMFLLLPTVLAVPVLLIFTFLPREALRTIYSKSIDAEKESLRAELQSESLNPFEKRLLLTQFNKMCHEELRHSLQLTLSDLPIAVTLLIMVLEPLIKR